MPMTMARVRAMLASVAALTLVATIVAAAPASAASPTACRVKNLDSGVTKPSLQKAVNAAKAGQRLTVQGTCKGTTTLGKSLAVKGVRTSTSGPPILDGKSRGTVVTVKAGVKATLTKLTIRGGGMPEESSGPDAIELEGDGGGIFNAGALVLKNVVVRNSTANQGAGAWNQGKLTLLGSTTFRANTAHFGGGVYNYAREGTVYKGTLTMKDKSSIQGNSAVPSNFFGPGSGRGGGVVNDGAKLTMEGSSNIRNNTVTGGGGGGVLNYTADQAVVLSGVTCGPAGRVRENTPDDCSPA
jgi:hypothetical protein